MNETEDKSVATTHVVIVGGGFAGLHCARKLAANRQVRVTLLDRHNYQQFQPLLYQVATAILGPDNVAFNLRQLLRSHPNVEVKLTEVQSVDLTTRVVQTVEGQQYQGDYLVLAAGAQANFFDIPGAEQYTYPMYSLEDAERIRSRILAMLESADRDPSLFDKGALNIVIVGAGPTGTELAGAIGDMLQSSVKKHTGKAYAHSASEKANVILVDAGHAVLSAFSPHSQAYAAKMLEERKVQIRLGTKVKEVREGHVTFSDGTTVDSHIVIWAGGLKASPLSKNLGIATGSGGRLDVQEDLAVPGIKGVYALGDFANIKGKDGKPLPQLGSVAEQSGKWCARNILLDKDGQPTKPFRYLDKGIMAIIGRNAGVAEVGEHRHELHGALAFAAWLGVHAALLSSTRAKIEAFFEWAWDYFGGSVGDAILDRPEQLVANWNETAEDAAHGTSKSAASSQ